MQKIKNFRSADCVVGGFRYGPKTKVIGSLLLGLFDEDGLLHHIGITSGIAAADRPALAEKVEKLISLPVLPAKRPAGRAGGAVARTTWQPLKPRSSLRCAMITSLAAGFAMAQSCSAGGRTIPYAMHNGSPRPEEAGPAPVAEIGSLTQRFSSRADVA